MRLILFFVLANILICTCGYAADLSIHSMVIGKKTLELVENRQVTFKADGDVIYCKISPNGRYVAYLRRIDGATSVTIAKISGGSAKYTRVVSAPSDPQSPQPSFWMSDVRSMEWSPDSKLLLLEMLHSDLLIGETVDGGVTGATSSHYALVLRPDCTLKTSIPLVSKNPQLDINGNALQILISADSRSLVVLFSGEKNNRNCQWLQSIDISTGSEHVLCSFDKPLEQVLGWADDSSIICWRTIHNENAHNSEILSIDTSNGTDKHFYSKQLRRLSSDGKYMIPKLEPQGIRVQNTETQQFIQVTNTENASFVDWVPKNQMFLYSVEQSIKDESGKRNRAMRSLWLASIIERDNNAMCVALDFDGDPGTTVSSDCSRIAYVSKGRLYIAELEWRDPTVDEKIAAGLKLTEEEEKQVLTHNAKVIGIGVHIYAADYDDAFPPLGALNDNLKDYLKVKNVFNRPGTNTNIFKCMIAAGTKITSIEDPAETPMGELDAGYSWKVVVYADSHVEVVQK